MYVVLCVFVIDWACNVIQYSIYCITCIEAFKVHCQGQFLFFLLQKAELSRRNAYKKEKTDTALSFFIYLKNLSKHSDRNIISVADKFMGHPYFGLKLTFVFAA